MKKAASIGYSLFYCLVLSSPFMPSVQAAILLYQRILVACHNIRNPQPPLEPAQTVAS
jgi:hypothetical protein